MVRIAVAVLESVFLIPHFASMEVSPANRADPNANRHHARWGVKYAYEVYDLVSQGEEMRVRHEPVNQVSVYYDNLLRISPEFSVQVGVHGVAYCPQHHR